MLNPIEKHKSEIEKRINQLESKFREVNLRVCRNMKPMSRAGEPERSWMRIDCIKRKWPQELCR
jgi:hypothetical protein